MYMNGTSNHVEDKPKSPSKLILCFDGTGNKYSGNPSDTNIVKLYQKFDREDPNQHHYYQPGIGTYSAGEGSLNSGILGRFTRSISQKIDEGIGTTFDQHVIAGYRFIMRYYIDGDQISIFGFSRGAFTARFLARMISEIGLLSMGNEEMVPFAYKSYQDWETGNHGKLDVYQHQAFLKNFKTTFCRTNVKPYFLGLFDTVNSVGVFDLSSGKPTALPVFPETATYIRHAVSVDERRAKFKAALLHQDDPQKDGKLLIASLDDSEEEMKKRIREVYFPGNHGDVGGGWEPEVKPEVKPEDKPEDKSKGNANPSNEQAAELAEQERKALKLSLNERERDSLRALDINIDTLDPLDLKELDDPVQLSDLALEWMIGELDNLPKLIDEVAPTPISWNDHKKFFLFNFRRKVRNALSAKLHDVLAFDRPAYWAMTLFWHFLEILPYHRLELTKAGWERWFWTPNLARNRDIPNGSAFHPSVNARKLLSQTPDAEPKCSLYKPQNTDSDEHAFMEDPEWNNEWGELYKNSDSDSDFMKKTDPVSVEIIRIRKDIAEVFAEVGRDYEQARPKPYRD